MLIEFDPRKRARTLACRELDFSDAAEVFADLTYAQADNRFDYGEERAITIGTLKKRWVVLVWTQRGAARRIISMSMQMIGKSRNTPTDWVDPDDAPELTAEFFEKGTPMIGGRVVTWEEYAREARKRGVPMNSENKVPVTIFYDGEIIAAFESTGAGWQQRMNDALLEWLKTNPPR